MKHLLAILFMLICHSAEAMTKNNELIIATFIEPPFVDEVAGELFGEHIDIARLLAKSINIKPVFVRCPFARCLTMVKRGQADMIFGLLKIPEREKDLIFLHPPYMVQHYPLRFYTLADKHISIDGFDDLKPLSVGVLRGASYFDLFDKDDSIKKVELTSRPQLVQMLLRGRIDTFLEREESIRPLLPEQEYKQKLSLASYQYSHAVNSFIAISKHSEVSKYATDLAQEIDRLLKNGTIEMIRKKKYID